MNNRTATLAIAAAIAALAGCSAPGGGGAGAEQPSSLPSPGTSAASVSAVGVGVGHVHNLAIDGDAVLLGTHQGLFRQDPGQQPIRVGEPFDVMGLSIGPDRWLSSGHSAGTAAGPADLGLLESLDSGATWRSVSLSGEVDFHRLTGSGASVLGVNSGDGQLWRSTDNGGTWNTHGAGPFDVAMDPDNAGNALATAADGPRSSGDGGQEWGKLPGAPLLALLAWTNTGVIGADVDGAVHRSDDGGATWTRVSSGAGQPSALAADDTRILVLQAGTVWQSMDAGRTFTERITDLPE